MQKFRELTTEAAEQCKLIEWANINSGFYNGKVYSNANFPELKLLFHIPNGGKRDGIEAAHLKAQGVKAGVPDLCLPVPRGGYHGMFIEMKSLRQSARLTDNQREWISALSAQGYKAVVCHGFDEAVVEIYKYLSL